MTRNDGGQTVVEFMLMLPFIFLVLLMLIESGAMLHSYVTVNSAAAEAGRWAAVANEPGDCNDGSSIQWRASETSGGHVNCGNTAFTIEYVDPTTQGTGVSVELRRTYTPVTPLPNFWEFLSFGAFPSNIEMTACSDARLELPMDGSNYVIGNGTCGG